uniref:hypothetical protein n=1 Tax=Blautia wexlerae TaxID=418240 RepID=UPI003D2E2943
MGWAIMFLVLIALVIILSISLINWKIQIYKVIVQLNAILNRKTKKLVTVSCLLYTSPSPRDGVPSRMT